jgi:hypothetical protein
MDVTLHTTVQAGALEIQGGRRGQDKGLRAVKGSHTSTETHPACTTINNLTHAAHHCTGTNSHVSPL